MSKKRVHSESDSDEDRDYEVVSSGQNRGPTRRAPKRQAAAGAAQLVRSVTQNEAQSESDEEYESNNGGREDLSGDERTSYPTRKAGPSTKGSGKRRIESDEDSDGEPSSPPANEEPLVKPMKIKLRLSSSNSSKSRKSMKDEKPNARSNTDGPTKRPALPKRPSMAPAAAQTATPPLIKKPPARPTDTNLSNSRDLDLTNPATMMSLFKSTAAASSTIKEQQPGVHEALREAARKAREAEAKNTFDLMAASEKIRAFEACLEGMGVWPLPQVLLHPLSAGSMAQSGPPNGSQPAS